MANISKTNILQLVKDGGVSPDIALTLLKKTTNNNITIQKVRNEVLDMVKRNIIENTDALAAIKNIEEISTGGTSVYPPLYFQTQWVESNIEDVFGEVKSGKIILFDYDDKLLDNIRSATTIQPSEIILVSPAEKFKEKSHSHFKINPEKKADYTKLFKTIDTNDNRPITIIHNWSKYDFDAHEQAMKSHINYGVISLLFLCHVFLNDIKKKAEIFYFYHGNKSEVLPQFSGVSGFAKTMNKESKMVAINKVIQLDKQSLGDFARIFNTEYLHDKKNIEVRYKNGKRYVKQFEEIKTFNEVAFKDNGVYVITGGLGGLGLIFAEYISQSVKANIILTGRSGLNDAKTKMIEKIKAFGSNVEYIQADVSNKKSVKSLIEKVKSRYGKINGTLHSAGITRDTYVIKKEKEEFLTVVAPKVFGTTFLDNYTKHEELDFLILFSSITAAVGNPAQSDYAYANTFMDYFAEYRNNLVTAKKRSGKTLSINWPLWKEGGMQVDEQAEKFLEKSMGMVPLSTITGKNALVKGLGISGNQLLVVEGNRERITDIIGINKSDVGGVIKKIHISTEHIENEVRNFIVDVVSDILKIGADDIDTEQDLSDYGFDSVTFTEFANRVNDKYNLDITPATFFEYADIASFVKFLIEEYKDVFTKLYPSTGSVVTEIVPGEMTVKEIQSKQVDYILPQVESFVVGVVSNILKIDTGDIDTEQDLSDYGFDSVTFTEFANQINDKYNLDITPATFFEYSDIASFVGFLTEEYNDVFRKFYPSSGPVITEHVPVTVSSDKIKGADSDGVLPQVEAFVVGVVSNILKLDTGDIDTEQDLSDYGFDSVTFTEFANRINDKYNLDITPAVFFEYADIASFVEFLVSEYEEVFSEVSIDKDRKIEMINPEIEKSYRSQAEIKKDTETQVPPLPDNKRALTIPIAVIGVNGRFPQSDNLEAYWKNLVEKRDCVSEIPENRWDWKKYWGDPLETPNKSNSKWGGFMNDVDKFDASFFKLSPREAIFMDPQQRLFLETVWKTIEDAGYNPRALSGSKTGIFVGVATRDYEKLLDEHGMNVEAQTSIGMFHSIVPNRISYLLNFHGPSEPIDTACSSSLVAIHRAIDSIKNGDCDMAIAGGVNVLLAPKLYISFAKAGMLSPDGRCKTFDGKANGYVRGEGVGAVLLKPLDQAEKDGDHIYAVIKGSAINHGGHAKSLTAPNPNAQAELLIKAYEKAGISPETVSYIEAHGTGTSLGDPIEINALKKAFNALYKKRNKEINATHCGISSVKTNIGHLETAAGIAGIIKIIYAMKYKTLPGTVHFSDLNPYIKLDNSPFYIIENTQNWDNYWDVPRRAGVSSFGFGGVNAHIVLEEYLNIPHHYETEGRQVVVLTALNEKRLKEYAKELLDYLLQENKKTGNKVSLAEIAHTLQTGREIMDERLAIIAHSKNELVHSLKLYLDGQEGKNIYYGNVKTNKMDISLLIEGNTGAQIINLFIQNKEYEKIAKLWVTGADIEWTKVYTNRKINKVSLPTYPFDKKSYWFKPFKEIHIQPMSEPKSTKKPIAAKRKDVNKIKEIKEVESPKKVVSKVTKKVMETSSLSGVVLKNKKNISSQEVIIKPIGLKTGKEAKRENRSLMSTITPDGVILKNDKLITGKKIHPPTIELKTKKEPNKGKTQVKDRILLKIKTKLAGILSINASDIDNECSFSDFGVDLVQFNELVNQINMMFSLNLPVTLLEEYSNIDMLTSYLVTITSNE